MVLGDFVMEPGDLVDLVDPGDNEPMSALVVLAKWLGGTGKLQNCAITQIAEKKT